MNSPATFKLLGDLPKGTVVLQASAGTGKTFAITGLAVRFIAEQGLSIRQVLMVTFGTAATDELRSRVYDRLLSTADDLRGALDGIVPDNALSAHLAASDPTLRLERVERALAEFDQSTIATTHTFCSKMLTTLGIIADWDGRERFVKDLTDLTKQACDDLYVRRFVTVSAPPFSLREAHAIASAAVGSPAEIDESPHPEHVAFAREVRAEVHRRKTRERLYTYDDLIEKMLSTLSDLVTAEPARQRLRAAFPVVLADEFQDTDPDQWRIVDRAFRGHSTLVLVGDPKQSIYAFRNADINAYLAASTTADALLTLPVNYRSDSAVTHAVTELFRGVDLGSDQIRVHSVTSGHEGERLRIDGQAVAPITIREVRADKDLSASEAAAKVDDDVVDQVHWLLANATYDDKKEGTRRLRPGDIAILTRQRARAEQLRQALSSAGVQAVYSGASSIFETSAARDWALVLANWCEPGAYTARHACITDIVGHTYADLMADQLGVVGRAAEQLAIAGRVAREDGVAAGWLRLRQIFEIDARLLARLDGRPSFTDLGHVAELLDDAASRNHLSVEGVRTWLADHMRRARTKEDGTDMTRRLDGDDDAVAILTMHGAKGLQFPVVLLPTPTTWTDAGKSRPFVYTDDGQRRLFVGDKRGRSRALNLHTEEAQAEELRLLYVALTRAECAVIAWWTQIKGIESSALHRLLARLPKGELRKNYPSASPLGRAIAQCAVRFEAAGSTAMDALVDQRPPRTPLAARTFSRAIDTTWRRTSYSGLTAQAHEFNEGIADEPETPDDIVAELTGSGAPLPMGELPGGVAFGSLVHGVLEYLDWSKGDLHQNVQQAVTAALHRLPPTGLDEDALVNGLIAALRTPLGVLTGGRALVDLPVDHRLAELDFDLPMGGAATRTVGDLASLMASELALDDPLRDYPTRLADSAAAPEVFNGFLTGSIDAVLSTGNAFVVVDYKTNKMPTRAGQSLTVGHYGRDGMAEMMMSSHYPLQALLYSVALHRFLAWRLPGYRPETSLGGVGYLFVRGMIGPDTPVIDGMPAGVFTWRPSASLITKASQLLGGRDA